MSEKSEKATPYKLQKARSRGQVSKSAELNTCIALFVLLATAHALGPDAIAHLKPLCMRLLSLSARFVFSIDTLSQLQHILLSTLMSLWLPFALAGILSLVVSSIAQTGFVWSGNPLTPDFKRLDITKGFKRLFSLKRLFDVFKNVLKLSLAFLLLSISLRHELPVLLNLMKTTPAQFSLLFTTLLSKIILQLLILLLAMAMLDKFYTQWTFGRDQRMSKQELKDEYRQREGDPKIKAKIKQLQHQQRLKTTSLENIKTADVVITHPRHFAIVLRYERGKMPAPKVVCKAQGDRVKQVEILAARHQVPIFENRSLARLLFTSLDLNQWINREHFPLVALVLQEIYRKKNL